MRASVVDWCKQFFVWERGMCGIMVVIVLKKIIDHELSSLNFKGGLSLIFMCRLDT